LARTRRPAGGDRSAISNGPLDEEQREQAALPPRGEAAIG
jgi:hypothetical protein